MPSITVLQPKIGVSVRIDTIVRYLGCTLQLCSIQPAFFVFARVRSILLSLQLLQHIEAADLGKVCHFVDHSIGDGRTLLHELLQQYIDS
jgi:hypothetical protein